MARSKRSSSGARPSDKFESKSFDIKIRIKIPRRKVTLLTITLLLNFLLWSSVFCVIASIFQAVSDPDDATNIAPVVLNLTSAFATIFYTILHTVFSLKQRVWTRFQRNPTAIKSTSYIAIRVVVSLCVLWLLTCGWNMIIVARRPVCADKTPGLQGWEYGATCQMSRAGMAFAMIALLASFGLFGILNTARRPFEAHLYKHGYQQTVDSPFSALSSTESSPARGISEKHSRDLRRSMSTFRTGISDVSTTDIDTLNLDRSSPPVMIHAPSPVRSVGMGPFTSSMSPPPIPSAYGTPRRASSLDTLSHVAYPSVAHRSLAPPPRLFDHIATAGYVPFSVPAQYSASAWRAVHPIKPSPLRPISRSHPHLRDVAYSPRNHASRASVSLTRPRRLSVASSNGNVAWSSNNGSTETRSRLSEYGPDQRPRDTELAYAILHGTPIPDVIADPYASRTGQVRISSAPDPTFSVPRPGYTNRMAIGWRPRLPDSTHHHSNDIPGLDLTKPEYIPIKATQLVHSRSAGFLSRFSPDTSPDDDETRPCLELEKELEAKTVSRKPLPARRSWSVESSRVAEVTSTIANPAIVDPAQAASVMLSRMPRDIRLHKRGLSREEAEKKQRSLYDEIKNKPLPRIAVL